MHNPLPSRRAFLGATGTLVGASLTACDRAPQRRADTHPAPVAATGMHQAGITTPRQPQQHLLAVVADVAEGIGIAGLLADVGRTISRLADGRDRHLAGMSAGDLTITVGVGPRLVARVDPALPGAEALPHFSREQLTDRTTGGDLYLQVCAADPTVVSLAVDALMSSTVRRLTERWRQAAVRGPAVPITAARSAPRNPLGFVDGIVAPHTDAALDDSVWITKPSRLAGASIVVLRRIELDVDRFLSLDVDAQEAVFGRRRADGAPLSGGTIASDPDLGAKTPTGKYLIPVGAHIRRTNAIAIGVPTMLRRSYAIVDSAALMFISFQNELRTFTATLEHMDASDDLLAFTTTTAAATFLVLPGFTAERPLGSTLFDR